MNDTDISSNLDGLRLDKKVILQGSDNYNDWLRSITNQLVLKDTYEIATRQDAFPVNKDDVPSTLTLLAEQQKWSKRDRHAWAMIDSSLDRPIHNNPPLALLKLSAVPLVDAEGERIGQSAILLAHLTREYSAANGP
jgi:hypothetical protein